MSVTFQNILKNGHQNSPEPEVASSDCFFKQPNVQNPNDLKKKKESKCQ